MGLSLVRCPFCDRRYNVSGIPAGTKVLCTNCRSVLSVPAGRRIAREPLWRRIVPQTPSGQFVAALVGGLMLASGAYVGLRLSRSGAPAIHETMAAAPAAAPEEEKPKSRDEIVTSFVQSIYTEFDSNKFLFSDCPPFIMAAEKNEGVWMNGLFDYHRPALDLLYEVFMREFGEPLKLRDIRAEVLRVIIFTSRDSWDRYCEKSQKKLLSREIPGFYEYHNRRIVMIYDRAQAPLEVLMHESTHQLVHFFTLEKCEGARKATYYWFQEGLGTYFESLRRDSSNHISGHSSRLKIVKEKLESDETNFIPLSMLMGLTVDDFWNKWYTGPCDEKEQQERTRTAQLAYGEACALVLFLRHGEGGKYRRVFDDYFAAELRGEGSRAKFEELLRRHYPTMDLGLLQGQFTEWVKSLEL